MSMRRQPRWRIALLVSSRVRPEDSVSRGGVCIARLMLQNRETCTFAPSRRASAWLLSCYKAGTQGRLRPNLIAQPSGRLESYEDKYSCNVP